MGWIMIFLALVGLPSDFAWRYELMCLLIGFFLVIVGYWELKPACSACKSWNVIPANTPAGRELLPKTYSTQET
jgi:hypothetical protein